MVATHFLLLCAVRVLTGTLWGPGQFPRGAWFCQPCQHKTKRSSYTAVFLPGRWVSQRVSENELPVAHVLAGVQAACLLELFLHLSDKSGTRNTPHGVILPSPPGLRLAE